MDRICMGCMESYDDQLTVCPHCGYEHGTPAQEAYQITPGTILAERYIIGRVLGFGGFGVTYIGWDKTLEKRVAVKEYLPGEFSTRMPGQTKLTIYSGDKEEQFLTGREKFIDEARRLAKFQQVPEIIRIYDCFEENNTAYIVMEYLSGESLKEKLEWEGKMTVEQALPIILDVLHGLEAVHKEGILHRDIAPDNIYITNEGQVKLLDFGAARFATTTHSRSLTVLIKPGFAPEEQYRSRGDQGPWTDVYAVAATFYRMITGETPEDALERAAKDTVRPPSKLQVKIGPNTENAIMNALNVKIQGRTQSAEQFEAELLANVVKRVVVKKTRVDIGKWPLWVKISSGLAALGIAVFISLIAGGIIRFDISKWGAQNVPEGKTRIPNLVNEEMEDAVTRGENANLTVQVYDKQYSKDIPADKVLSQTIKSGTVVDVKETLGIIISAGIEKTYVPNVIGMEEEEALSQLKEAGLVVKSESREYRAAPGTIGWQSLDSGAEVDTGTAIELIVSTGIKGGNSRLEEELKDLTGLNFDEAADELLAKYLYLVKIDTQYSDVFPEGTIISQETKAESKIPQNSNVKVVVSLGKEMVYVADLQFKTEAEARALLEEAQLAAEIYYEANSNVASGNVIRQDTNAGQSVEKGSSVVFYVSTGPASRTPQRNPTETTRPTGGREVQTAPAPVTNVPELPRELQGPGNTETAPQAVEPPAPPKETQPPSNDEIWDIIGD